MHVTRDQKKIALNELQTFVLAWMDENADVDGFSHILDRLSEVDSDIETARWEL